MNNLTITDIAREAGVSKATVSRVINHTGAVSEQTRRKVEAVIAHRGFSPSATARSLSRGTSSTVSFVVPEIDNPFFGEMLRGVMDVLDSQGLTAIIYNTEYNEARNLEVLGYLKNQQPAGLLYTPGADFSAPADRKQLYQLLEQLDVPAVIMDRDADLTGYDSVFFNDYQGTFDATDALIRAGHRKIGIVNATLDTAMAIGRHKGYLDALASHGIEPCQRYMFFGTYQTEEACVLSRQLLAMADRPTAVLTCNNRITMGFLRALYERGEQLPNDIACVSLDRIEALDSIQLPLNYIERDAAKMGREAANLLVSRMANPGRPRRQLILDTRVVVKYI